VCYQEKIKGDLKNQNTYPNYSQLKEQNRSFFKEKQSVAYN